MKVVGSSAYSHLRSPIQRTSSLVWLRTRSIECGTPTLERISETLCPKTESQRDSPTVSDSRHNLQVVKKRYPSFGNLTPSAPLNATIYKGKLNAVPTKREGVVSWDDSVWFKQYHQQSDEVKQIFRYFGY